MKKVLIAALALVSMSATAQKGSTLVYGNVGLSSSKGAGASKSTTSYNLAPGVGYQLNDNWTAGINLNIAGSKDAAENKNSTFGAGPFVRYTKGLGNIFSLYGQLDLGFSGSKYTPKVGAETKSSSFGAMVWPAVGVHVSKGFGLNFGFGGLGFSSNKDKGASKSSSSFGLTFGQQVNVGISKNFGRTK